MSGLKRLVTRRRAADTPTKDSDDRASAPLVRRFTPRREPPVTPPPTATSNISKQLDISAAMAAPPINPPDNYASTDSAGTPRAIQRKISGTLPTLFQLCRFSVPHRTELAKLLAPANQPHVLMRADAERFSLATAMDNGRDLAVADRVLETYIPYALSCADMAQQLKAKGINISTGIVWLSGLVDATSADATFSAGLGLEVAMVLMVAAVNKLRQVVENNADFGMQSEDTIVAQTKSLQAAAGIFEYVRDTVAPSALCDYVGTPPPEIVPDTASMFYALSLAMAQALRVRRAALGGMSEALLAKLSVAAVQLTEHANLMFDKLLERQLPICAHIRLCIDHLLLLCKGWMFQYAGLLMSTDTNSGEKVAALRAALENMQQASKSPIFGKVAKLDLDKLEREHEDAASANSIVHRHAIPTPDKILLPAGRALATATKFEAPRVPGTG